MKITRKWQCSKCDELHDDEWKAEECCQPEVYEVFLCPVCDAFHGAEDEAIACCDSAELVEDNYHIAPEVLELYGQQRLGLDGFEAGGFAASTLVRPIQ